MRAMKNASTAALVGIWTILLTAFVVTILYVGRQLLIPLAKPKVLQDVDLERTMIHAIAAGLGVALVPEQLKKTRTRECGVPASESHGRDGRLCRMEERKSIGCSASVRADRRTNGTEHQLGKRHAVAAFPTIADCVNRKLRESPNPVCAHSIPGSPLSRCCHALSLNYAQSRRNGLRPDPVYAPLKRS
jgi:hypothetical protein